MRKMFVSLNEKKCSCIKGLYQRIVTSRYGLDGPLIGSTNRVPVHGWHQSTKEARPISPLLENDHYLKVPLDISSSDPLEFLLQHVLLVVANRPRPLF